MLSLVDELVDERVGGLPDELSTRPLHSDTADAAVATTERVGFASFESSSLAASTFDTLVATPPSLFFFAREKIIMSQTMKQGYRIKYKAETLLSQLSPNPKLLLLRPNAEYTVVIDGRTHIGIGKRTDFTAFNFKRVRDDLLAHQAQHKDWNGTFPVWYEFKRLLNRKRQSVTPRVNVLRVSSIRPLKRTKRLRLN